MELNKITDEKLKKWRKILLIFNLIWYPFMGIFFWLSKYPAAVFESQLSFSGEILKSHYQVVVDAGGLNMYIFGQILDYLFMVGYGSMIFCIALLESRKFEESSTMAKSGRSVAIGGIIAAILDAIENFFILLTLSDPLGFPNWWAVAHSIFALPKWILLFYAIFWYIASKIVKPNKK
jgi:hypothetical protein